MRIIILLTILTLHYGYADIIGGEISFGIVSHTPSGDASYKRSSSQNFENTFGFNETQDLFFKGYLEHPLPLLPNVKLGYTTFSTTGDSNVELFNWGSITDFTGHIENSLSLDVTDATLYYELLDNWLEADTGLTFRYISGDMRVDTNLVSQVINFSTLTPMLYGKIRTNIPSTDLSFQVEANAISFSGINAYDYELSARYTFYMGLGIEMGYKAFHLENDELTDTLNVNANFSGPYATAIWDY